jgi:hypothetical protein
MITTAGGETVTAEEMEVDAKDGGVPGARNAVGPIDHPKGEESPWPELSE